MRSAEDNVRVHVRAAAVDDFPAAIDLLNAARLPTDDLTPAHLAWVAESRAQLVGLIGMERFGDVGLLRSLVVSPQARCKGIGRSLVKALESTAREHGMRILWLLTTDAERYFSTLDFRAQDRAAAPGVIQSTAEFSRLCPGDAVLMSKTIAAR